MSHAIKLALLADGRYAFKAPPVCTWYWNDDWVSWVDACKGWRPQRP
jgi:hypothetical protein